MIKSYVVALLMVLIVVSGCSMPATKIYSLAIPEEKAVPAARPDASVNITLHAPRYLSQSYIAYRNSPYEIEISKYSRWDAPPSDLVRESFREALPASGIFKEVKTSPVSPDGFYTLEINLKRFERSDEGETSFGLLVFEAKLLSPAGRELYSDTVSKKVRLEEKSFLALAKGLSEALSDGISDIKTGTGKAVAGPK